MTARTGKQQRRAVVVAVLFALIFCSLARSHTTWAEEPPIPTTSLDLPEGSSSVIESLTWRVVGSDLVSLREQTKAIVGQIAEAVIVKENESLLIISLPTQKLPAVHQELSKLGSISTPETEATPHAPTTLLRLRFVRP